MVCWGTTGLWLRLAIQILAESFLRKISSPLCLLKLSKQTANHNSLRSGRIDIKKKFNSFTLQVCFLKNEEQQIDEYTLTLHTCAKEKRARARAKRFLPV